MTHTLLPPGPRPKFPGQFVMELQRNPLTLFQRIAASYGELAYFKISGQPMFLLGRPDDIRDVLVTHDRNFMKGRALQRAKRILGEGLLTSEGDFHLRQRRLAQPAFHRKRVANYATAMVHYAEQTNQAWQQRPDPHAPLDVAEAMAQLTLAIVGKTLFDAEVGGEASEIGQALNTAMELFQIGTLPFGDLIEKLPLPSTRRFAKARARLDETVYRIINQRRRSGADHGDLLSMLLLAQDEEGSGSMSDTQLRDEAMTIFLAGHETTANALTWTWYLLSQHPEVEARFHAELDQVLAGRQPTLDDLPNLRYTEMLLAESMRLYPPAWLIGRRAIEDYQIGEYHVPAKSILIMSQYIMHHNPLYFPDPERFDPERWTLAAKESRPKYSYFPFGGGPRQCIGEQFAWMEGILLLATIGQRWQLKLVPDHPIVMQPRVTLRPKYGMHMTLVQR